MEIKIKVKRPGKGMVHLEFNCSAAELKDMIAASTKAEKHLRKNTKNKDM
jgi:hypothetical protein